MKKKYCWHNGQIIEGDYKVSSFCHGLHYPSSVWEGMRAYEKDDGSTHIFKLKEHVDRLFESAKVMELRIPYTREQVVKACNDLVTKMGGGDLYLRPIIYNESPIEGVVSEVSDHTLDIYAVPVGTYAKDGIKAVISSYSRGYPYNFMQIKAAMNYGLLDVLDAEAKRSGAKVVLVANKDGYILESAVANIFLFKKGKLITSKNEGDILNGITRQTLCSHYPVEERNITRQDLYLADEVFLCGTYAEITPVTNIDGHAIGTGKIGYMTKDIMKSFDRLTRGV